MNLIDGIVSIFILYFAWIGFRNGLVKEVFRIVGLVLACFFAFQYADFVGPLLHPLLDIPSKYLPYIGFALIFALSFFAVQIGIIFLDSIIQLLLLSIPNRLFGSLFGIIKGSLMVSIVLIFLSGFNYPKSEVIHNSLLYRPILNVAPASYDVVARVLPGVKPYKDSVDNYLSLPEIKE